MAAPKEKSTSPHNDDHHRDLTVIPPEIPERKTLWNTILTVLRPPQPPSIEQDKFPQIPTSVDMKQFKRHRYENQTPKDKDHETKSQASVSGAHTLHGQLSQGDLLDKGHSFDTTDVQLGESQLKKLPSQHREDHRYATHQDGQNYTSVTGFKVDLDAPPVDHTRTKFNVFHALKSWKAKGHESNDQTKPKLTQMQESEQTKIYSPDETIQMALPKDSRREAAIRSGRLFLYTAVIVLALYFAKDLFVSLTQSSLFSESSSEIQSQENPNDQTTNSNTGEIKSIKEKVNTGLNQADIGRGLIYSCAHQQFICTDKANYIKCRQLAKNNKGKTKSCAVQGVFDSLEDCLRAKNSGTKSAQGLCN